MSLPRATRATAILLLGLGLVPTFARAVPEGYSLEIVQSGLDFPTALRFSPDGRLFFLERGGRILCCSDSGRASPTEWATVPTYRFLEDGLLGLDFHPDFADSPFVYVFHTLADGNNVVARLRDVGGIGADYTILWSIPRYTSLHQGGRIAFGSDGMLYINSGDQNDIGSVPNLASPRGKLLRVTPVGGPAPGNPFAENPQVYAYGFRNHFGLCFDPTDGTGYMTENGPSCDDEINLVIAGANYGWSAMDSCGRQPAGAQPAVVTMTPTIAPTGCCVYRGAAYPGLDGDLFFGSWNRRELRRVAFHGESKTEVDSMAIFHTFAPLERVIDVTVGPDGLMWILTSEWSYPGTIWRLIPPVLLGVEPAGASSGFRAHPNPFTGTVVFDAPAGSAIDELEVFDIRGRLVRRWSRPSGRLIWDGRDRQGGVLRPGVYFVRASRAGSGFTLRLARLGP